MVTLQVEIDTQIEFKRTLPWWQLLAIGLGAIIGAGIFVLSGQAASRYAGPSVIVSFILTGIIALFSALSFSELGAMMPLAGSVYTYTYAGVSKATGFRFLAWTLLGQVIYFSYGYWHSKRRELSRNDSINSMIELTANHEITTENCTPGEVDMGLASVHSENQA
ncbi:unnamed protein product [Rotaria socialis]